ncbi:hypothetical protein GCM10009616_21190 [Microlunatus lacustris]
MHFGDSHVPLLTVRGRNDAVICPDGGTFLVRDLPEAQVQLQREPTVVARQLELDEVRAVTTTVANAALWEPEIAARRDAFARSWRSDSARPSSKPRARGHLALTTDSAAAADLLLGLLYYRSTIEHAPIDDPLVVGRSPRSEPGRRARRSLRAELSA